MEQVGVIIPCHTKEEFDQQLQKAIESKKLVVIDFTATWCGPCRIMLPLLEDWAKEFPHVLFLKVDVDELKSVTSDWDVEAMPTFILVKEGNILERIVGVRKQELRQKIEEHHSTSAA
ncbi:hypothetical protein AMTRI_Chr03g53380 [Amborella trichopoda]|uniref:Thioredoxin n=1 Tax=Amborella trichopoda TaxID=13333 RepID=W1NUG2_AMBTC|nr:thioredoxin H1 [Amborella trichopoda]ERN01257.1 hypothetical protein AMTR_s00002p00246800 [Amborella trichopoda]|eukprot:XP_006838688.1 thioredoxin H1 [Amborella trichopoda]